MIDSTAYRLKVLSYPDTATVFIDDVLRGYTPYSSSDIEFGPHTIRLVKQGNPDSVHSLNIVVAKPITINVRLRIPGALTVRSQPPGASVYLDGKLLGLTPLDAGDLLPGIRKLMTAAPDYKDLENMVVVLEGDTAKVVMNMISKYGSLSLFVESDFGEVFIDEVDGNPSDPKSSNYVPSASTNLYRYPASLSTILVAWRDRSYGETGFQVERRELLTSFFELGKTEANEFTFEDNSPNLVRGRTWYYGVKAFTASTQSEYSAEASIRLP